MKIDCLVVLGTSVMVELVAEREKAVQVRNVGGSPDNAGRTCWIPKSALKIDPVRTYGDHMQAWTLEPWMVRRLNRFQLRALDLLC